MRSIFLLSIIAIAFQAAVFVEQDKLDLLIAGEIPLLKQPKEMDCWITVATMLYSWRHKKTFSVEAFANQIGDPWKFYYETNTGLPAKDQEAFVKTLGLKGEPPANYTIGAYINLIRSNGPIWITTGDGFSAHARILIGLKGSGDYGTTKFIFIDPATGKKAEQESLIFLKKFEEEARVANEEGWENLRIQIYHY